MSWDKRYMYKRKIINKNNKSTAACHVRYINGIIKEYSFWMLYLNCMKKKPTKGTTISEFPLRPILKIICMIKYNIYYFISSVKFNSFSSKYKTKIKSVEFLVS